MKKQEFDKLLKDINLTRKEFANLTKSAYSTISNWNDEKKPVPGWVKSWLENYIEKQKHQKMLEILKESGVCHE